MREAQREYISSDEADFELSGEHPHPAAVLWQYFVDPEKRLRWQPLQTAIRNEANQHGPSPDILDGRRGPSSSGVLGWLQQLMEQPIKDRGVRTSSRSPRFL